MRSAITAPCNALTTMQLAVTRTREDRPALNWEACTSQVSVLKPVGRRAGSWVGAAQDCVKLLLGTGLRHPSQSSHLTSDNHIQVDRLWTAAVGHNIAWRRRWRGRGCRLGVVAITVGQEEVGGRSRLEVMSDSTPHMACSTCCDAAPQAIISRLTDTQSRDKAGRAAPAW